MDSLLEAYLDIENTGLSPYYNDITVIGIHLVDGNDSRLIQLVGEYVTENNLLEALEGADAIFTYHGSRFDLPFIRAFLGVRLADIFHHHDLMYDCWRKGLYGGLKAVERQLGISRQVKGVDGFQAVILWGRYRNHGDEDALALLLQYNKEDVVNLKTLRQKLSTHNNFNLCPTAHEPWGRERTQL